MLCCRHFYTIKSTGSILSGPLVLPEFSKKKLCAKTLFKNNPCQRHHQHQHHHSSQQPKLPVDIRGNSSSGKQIKTEYPVRVTRQGSRIEYPFDVGRLSRQGSRVSATIRRNTGLSIDGQSLIDWPSLEGWKTCWK